MSLRSLSLSLAALPLLAALIPAQDKPAASIDWSKAVAWRELGPASMSGRIVAISVNPKDASNYWVATASGGLLKTTNNGVTYEHQFDHEATVSIGDVCVAPSDPSIVWVGSGEENPRNSVSYGDGVYKSTDSGKTWKNMGLRETFQIGSVVVHPTDADVVYVGALGRLYGPNEARGLYKTTDGGETWDKVFFVDENTGVIDIDMHPEDPDTLIVATYERRRDGFDGNAPAVKIAPGSGLYRTKDGGKTFEKLGGGLPTVDMGRIGVDWYQADPDVVFAIIETERIGMARENAGWHGIAAQRAETGAKVVRLDDKSPAAEAGLAKDDIVLSIDGTTVLSETDFRNRMLTHVVGEKITLEVARGEETHEVVFELIALPEPDEEEEDQGRRRSDPSRPFGQFLGGQAPNVQDFQGPDGHEHGGIYRSDDGGTSWKRINSVNPRPMYFSQVRVDPNDDQRLFVLGISAYQSKDGGKTFTGDFSRGVHSDHHALWIDPSDGRHMLIGSDGGLYATYDRGQTWQHHNTQALGQFYHVAVGPRRDYWVYGGLQDNGTWGAPHRGLRGGGTVNEDWIRVGGGDGFLVYVDENDPDQIYYSSQNGGTARTHLATMEGGRIRPTAPRGTRYRFNWRTPFLLSHFNSRIYYNAGNHVFRSFDRGNDLKAISPEITRTDRGSATALAESPRSADVLYVGTDDGALWRSKDGGATWTDLWVLAGDLTEDEEEAAGESAPQRGGPREPRVARAEVADNEEARPLGDLVPAPRWVSAIEPSRAEEGRVYLTLDGHRSDDDDPYVLVSEDHGDTWRSLRNNLPWGSTRVVREDRENPNVLYLGTEFGVWFSLDRGTSWQKLNGNLPTVAIHEIAQHATSGEIVVGTHGRSLWAADVTPIRRMTDKVKEQEVALLKPNSVVLWQRKHSRGSSGGASRYQAENPDSEAEIFVQLKDPVGSTSLTIRDASGKQVRSLEVPTTAGLHRITWDLRGTPPAAQAQSGQRGSRGGRFRRGAPRQPAGTYSVVLEVDGTTMTQPLVLEPDPNQ